MIFKCRMLLCVLAVAMFTSLTVSADVIWTPYFNDFYMSNYSQCEACCRSYMANSETGFITVYSDPVSKKYVDGFSNGASFYVSFTYIDSDNTEWGVVCYEIDESGNPQRSYDDSTTGWIKMSETMLIYDEISFKEEHESEFSDKEYVFNAGDYETVVLWTYPNSGVHNGYITASDGYFDEKDYKINMRTKWVDENGVEWGKIDYFFAQRGWVCLSDPEKTDFPVNEVTNGLYPPVEPSPQTGNSDVITVVLLAVSVIAVSTVIIITVVFRKKSENS